MVAVVTDRAPKGTLTHKQRWFRHTDWMQFPMWWPAVTSGVDSVWLLLDCSLYARFWKASSSGGR